MIFDKRISTTPNQSVLSAPTIARDFLRLDLQFFAEPPGDDPQNDPGTPNPEDDEPPTLAELIKQYPTLKAELKAEKAAAVSKRFKNYDFDVEEARTALREKKERELTGEAQIDPTNDAIVSLSQKTNSLESKVKALSVENYAIANELDPKLLVRLGKDQIDSLQIDNDDFSLDSDELDEIVDGLRDEFPNLFSAPKEKKEEDPEEDPEIVPSSGFNPGSTQRTNKPPKSGPIDTAAMVAETLERLKASKRI